MSAFLILSGILGALLLGAMCPGPSFVLVSRIAAGSSRGDGLAASLGMGLGGALFAGLALFGLVAVLTQVEWLYLALRVGGGVYLIHLGIRIWRGAAQPLALSDRRAAPPASLGRSLLVGLVTQVSNPKTAVVYAGIFAAMLPAAVPTWLFAALPPLVFAVEFSWYAVVAVMFSATRPRSYYLRSKRWVDRAAGAIMGALGVRLVSETVLTRV